MVGINYLQFGRQKTEGFLTELALPWALLWLVTLWLAIGVGLSRKRWSRGGESVEVQVPSGPAANGPAANRPVANGDNNPLVSKGLGVVWLLMTVVGNGMLADVVTRQTEIPATSEWEEGAAFDYVVLLGGGVSVDERGQAFLNADGDRVRPIVQLWVAGRTKFCVVTGTAGIEGRPAPADYTAELLRSLGVPGDAIVALPGRNTSEEMIELRRLQDRWSQEHGGAQPRWGLVTSAFHLPRALRLARSGGMEPVPIPTASRVQHEPIAWGRILVPSAGAAEQLGRCGKEWLARLVGR